MPYSGENRRSDDMRIAENSKNIAVLDTEFRNVKEHLTKQDKKLDHIIDKLDTNFCTKQEMKVVKEDVKDNKSSINKIYWWALGIGGSVSAGVGSIFAWFK